MPSRPKPSTGAIYARQSIDHEQGIADQVADCEALADRLGWTVGERYLDNEASASNGRKRPEYERLLADIAAGRVDGLLFSQSTRLVRSPRELEDLIDILQAAAIPVESVRSGTYDLETADGRFMARQLGIIAKRETDLLGERLKRRWQENAAQGKPHGKPGYGWRRAGDVDAHGHRTGGRDVIVPAEADVVRSIVTKVLAGESISSITEDLNIRGIPAPASATAWSRSTVRQLALRPSNAALRIHQGLVVGTYACDPIITDDEHRRVTAIINDPARQPFKTNRPRHLLSGIARCGSCGKTLERNKGRSEPVYVCRACPGVRRSQEMMEEMVEALVIARLSRPDARLIFEATEDTRAMDDRRLAVLAKLDEVADSYANDKITLAQLEKISAPLRDEAAKLEAQISRSSGQPDLLDLAGPDIAARWEELPLDRKRTAIRALMTVEVMPHESRRGAPAYRHAESVVVRPVGQARTDGEERTLA